MTTAVPPPGPMEACLDPLLRALHWRGTPRQVAEARGARGVMDLVDLRNAMANLNFASRLEDLRLADVDVRLLPCLFVPRDGAPLVLTKAGEVAGTLAGFDAAAFSTVTIVAGDQRGTVCFFDRDSHANADAPVKMGWMRHLLHRFDGSIARLLGLSFVLNLLALAPALFVKSVYDYVLAAHEAWTLVALGLGVAIALGCDTALRVLRGAALAHIGARMDFLIGSAALRKLLSLPLARLERVSVGGRIAELRSFDGLRNVFLGPIALAFFDLPFIPVFIIAIALMAGWLALVPIVLASVLAGGGLLIMRYARAAAARNIATLGDYQGLLVEIVGNVRAIKIGAAEKIWLERFRERSAEMAFNQLRQARVAGLAETLAQATNAIAGAATLGLGAVLALNGEITVGSLIASMTLVWRLLAPIQALFVALTRLEDSSAAVTRVDQLMASPSEASSGARAARGRQFAGRVALDRVVLRYTPQHEPALAGVSLDVPSGQIIAITGPNGSGKSTILKVVAGLYQPQAGAVLIDGVDTRQLNTADLRHAIAYLTQQADLFTGTIADNLRLAHPTATLEELRAACAKAGALDDVEALPHRFDTAAGAQLAAGLVRKLALARIFLIDASVVLLDEPGADVASDRYFLRELDAMRGRKTVLLVTHRPDYVRAADRVVVLKQGAIVHDGPPQELMTKLAGERR